jgi:hypothetical protein
MRLMRFFLLNNCHTPNEQGRFIEFDFGNQLVRDQPPTDGTKMIKDPREMDYDVLVLVEAVIYIIL